SHILAANLLYFRVTRLDPQLWGVWRGRKPRRRGHMSREGPKRRVRGRSRSSRSSRTKAATRVRRTGDSRTDLQAKLKARESELAEPWERQAATAEVLQVISSSPGDLKPVFDTMLAKAVRICGAKFGLMFVREADGFRAVALHGVSPAFAEERRRNPVVR